MDRRQMLGRSGAILATPLASLFAPPFIYGAGAEVDKKKQPTVNSMLASFVNEKLARSTASVMSGEGLTDVSGSIYMLAQHMDELRFDDLLKPHIAGALAAKDFVIGDPLEHPAVKEAAKAINKHFPAFDLSQTALSKSQHGVEDVKAALKKLNSAGFSQVLRSSADAIKYHATAPADSNLAGSIVPAALFSSDFADSAPRLLMVGGGTCLTKAQMVAYCNELAGLSLVLLVALAVALCIAVTWGLGAALCAAAGTAAGLAVSGALLAILIAHLYAQCATLGLD